MSTVVEQALTLLRPGAHAPPAQKSGAERWSVDVIEALLDLPFTELMFKAQTVHRENFDPTRIEFATLLSVKTGGCRKTATTVRKRPATTPAWALPS